MDESLRKWRRSWRRSSAGVVGEGVGVGVEFDRLADRLRDRDLRMRAKMVGSDAAIRAYWGRGEPGEEDVAVEAGENGVCGASVSARFSIGLASVETGDVDGIA